MTPKKKKKKPFVSQNGLWAGLEKEMWRCLPSSATPWQMLTCRPFSEKCCKVIKRQQSVLVSVHFVYI